ncbi:MAG: HD domain-containing protein [Sedimentisphaerales bacterium]|nr:HD domain-containing protein [Sedimentisphaerales bacterium]
MITETVREYVFNECNSSRNAFGTAFFDQHLLVVREYGRSLAKVLGADAEIVELAAYLHDIAAVQDLVTLTRHPMAGAETARKLLQENGYPAERIERVARCIMSHASPVQMGCGLPEEVCLSNADAMSQITKPVYWLYYAFQIRQFGFAEGREWLRQRVESNWTALIRPARDMIEKEYRQTKAFLAE